MTGPYVIGRDSDGAMTAYPFDREEASVMFVNGCVAVCASADAVALIGEAVRGCVSAEDMMEKTDTALKRRSMYASVGAGDAVAVLVPFDRGQTVRLLI